MAAISSRVLAGQARGLLSKGRVKLVRCNQTTTVQVPTWFDAERDTVYVTGCGAGGGSAGSNTSFFGMGGGSGGSAIRLPIKLPSGTTELLVTIGAGGAAGTSAPTSGAAGGSTHLRLTDLTILLNLLPGGAGVANNDSNDALSLGGGVSYLGAFNYPNAYMPNSDTSNTNASSVQLAKMIETLATRTIPGIVYGTHGYTAQSTNQSFHVASSAGQWAGTPFGGGVTSVGYGYGGVRAAQKVVGAGSAGGKGVMVLEFVEEK
jgi:hypothetical protein